MTRLPVAPFLASLLLAAPLAGCIADVTDEAEPGITEQEIVDTTGVAEEPRQPGPLSIVYHHQIAIHADLDRVWDLIIDMPRYADWNPWIVYGRGEATPGARVPVGVVLNGHVLDMAYIIQVVEPETRFCTRDDAWFSGLIYGARCRTLTVQPDGSVVYAQELLVDGIFSGFADLTFGKATRDGMAAEAEGLKAAAEAP